MLEIKVPATTANLGPGFDCLGMALDMYSTFYIEEDSDVNVEIKGFENDKLTIENNLVIESMEKLFDAVGKRPLGYHLIIDNGIPLSRGLGSSATAVVGGLIAANYLVGDPLDKEGLLTIATEIEGHPDNVAPALYGSLTLSTMAGDHIVHRQIKPADNLRCVVFIPEYEVSTKDSRAVVPENYSKEDTLFSTSHLAFLIYGFMQEDEELIGIAMEDRIHEPYRKSLLKGFDEFKKSAKDHGAFAFSLSGAGSTVIAYVNEKYAEDVEEGFNQCAKELNVDGKAKILTPCHHGAIWEEVIS